MSLSEWQIVLAIVGTLVGAPLLVQVLRLLGAIGQAIRAYASAERVDKDERTLRRAREIELQQTITAMAEQFQKNGGSSLRDSIDSLMEAAERIETAVKAIDGRLTDVEATVAKNHGPG